MLRPVRPAPNRGPAAPSASPDSNRAKLPQRPTCSAIVVGVQPQPPQHHLVAIGPLTQLPRRNRFSEHLKPLRSLLDTASASSWLCWAMLEITQSLSQLSPSARLSARQRLAYDVLLYSAQRVGDAVRMQRSDIHDGVIAIVQQKTGTRVFVPLHPAL